MKTITKKAPSKLNIGLLVFDNVDNNYLNKLNSLELVGHKHNDSKRHYLETIFYRIDDIYDTIKVTKIESSNDEIITFGDKKEEFPKDIENSLIYKTLKEFKRTANISETFRVELDLNVPNKSGLGSSSSEAASLLNALNELSSFPLSHDEMYKIGSNLGSDISFFLSNYKAAKAYQYGDLLQEITLELKNPVIICFSSQFSTKDMYSSLQCFPKSDFDKNFNSFYSVAKKREPKIEYTLKLLQDYDTNISGMTGKGPTLFADFKTKEEANRFIKDISLKNLMSKIYQLY